MLLLCLLQVFTVKKQYKMIYKKYNFKQKYIFVLLLLIINIDVIV